jgi:hypothetical protein
LAARVPTAEHGRVDVPDGEARRAAPLPRYSSRPLPAVRHVDRSAPASGRAGGAGSRAAPATPCFDPERWQACEDYLHGLDLFNHGHFWECHEVLEGVWRCAGRRTPAGRLLQGLVQVAAALWKRELGAERAARRLAERGAAKLRAAPEAQLGLAPRRLAREVEAWLAGEPPPVLRLAERDATALARIQSSV